MFFIFLVIFSHHQTQQIRAREELARAKETDRAKNRYAGYGGFLRFMLDMFFFRFMLDTGFLRVMLYMGFFEVYAGCGIF